MVPQEEVQWETQLWCSVDLPKPSGLPRHSEWVIHVTCSLKEAPQSIRGRPHVPQQKQGCVTRHHMVTLENTDLCAHKQALIVHFRVRNNNKKHIIYGLMTSSFLLIYPSLFWFGQKLKTFQVDFSFAKEWRYIWFL